MSNLDDQEQVVPAEDIHREYRYSAGWVRLIAGPPFLAGMAVACVFTAIYLDRDVLLWRLILVPALIVRIVAAGAAVAAAIGFIAGIRDLCRRLAARQRIALTQTGILVPTDRGREQLIPYAAMSRIGLQRAPDTEALVGLEIDSLVGGFAMQQVMLPRGALEEIAETVQREFERHHQPNVIQHREAFWEAEREREQKYAAITGGAREAAAARTKKHKVLALPFGEVEPKVVAAFESAEKAEEYAKFLSGSDEYQWVRIEERKAAE
jgi:hypothetical protein